MSDICKRVNFKELDVEFHIYGSGMEESEIMDYININKDCNIIFHGRMDADKIKNEMLVYDVGLVMLITTIYGAVPSKIFELMQLKIPILFSGTGEGAEIVKSEKIGLCSDPNDCISLIKNIYIFKNMDSNSYNKLSKKCYNSHLTNYNLELELNKLEHFIK